MTGREGFILLALAAACFASLAAGSAPDRSLPSTVDSITSADLKSGLYFLASDEMQGRAINTLPNEIAAAYLAHRFELMGLEPVQNDNYFQHFSLVQSKLGDPNRLEIRSQKPSVRRKGVLKENFFPSTFSASGRTNSSAVFVGYGITAPEHDYDDYQGIDVRGKVALVMSREPGATDANSPFDGLLDSEYSRVFHKITNAQSHHAVGLIVVSSNSSDSKDKSFRRAARAVWPEDPARRKYHLKDWADRVQIPVAHVSSEMVEPLLKAHKTGLDEIRKEIDEGHQSRSFPLPDVKVRLRTAVVRDETRMRNVLSYLPGSDPKLREEIVVVSAHFDHVGARNGEIFNGADDDASGTVGLLEIAEAYSLQFEKPKRSVLFAAWNAEESGLLGSRYYLEQPVLPLDQTVAVFQMDMIGRNEEISDSESPRFRGLEEQTAKSNHNSVNILGYSRSEDLRHLVTATNQHIGLDLKFRYDNHPLNLLRRSDSWPFLVQGVPALFFHTGLHPDYHQPTDTADRINYAKMEKIVRLVFLCSWVLANSSSTPRLNSKSIGN